MELTFDKATGICEFEVTADFNLHLEREDVGTLHFYQRTTPHGEYDYIKNQGYNADDKVIDLDFQSLVYPKWIRIKSAVIPTVATISTDGEVHEVSYQAKEIEITSNGTTEVTADTGYTALGSVNVKVNVPSEGSGGVTPTELQRNDVNFFDYDGTLLYSYSWDEAKELGELPIAPSRDGMTFKEWNYTLEDIKAQSSDIYKGKADVGAVYVDGNGTQVKGLKDVIIIPRGTTFIEERAYSYQYISVLSIPNTVNTISYSAFLWCTFKDRVVIPISVEDWDVDGYYSFYNCTSPYPIWDNTRRTALYKNMNVANTIIEIPEWYDTVINAGFAHNGIVVVPKNMKNIDNAFGSYNLNSVIYFKDRDDIPNARINMGDDDVLFVVPDNLYDRWISATNWVGAQIVKRSDFGDL